MDLMPTVLGLLDYNKPYFAFGKDHFSEQKDNFAINYNGSAFQWINDSSDYIFDEKTTGDTIVDLKVKAFVQRYYLQMEKRKFVLDGTNK
jgi:geranylgeranyl pyrophosphate synthase